MKEIFIKVVSSVKEIITEMFFATKVLIADLRKPKSN
tara:strand:- start:1893 stop:2003 length:111 start_codon:yes stop_codon:yes gene_type:complete